MARRFVFIFSILLFTLTMGQPVLAIQPAARPAGQDQRVVRTTGQPLQNVVQVTANGSHTCVLTASGGVLCWGWNELGQLGDGSNKNRNNPVNVVGLTERVTAVAAGGGHTCALLNTGEVLCWGYNLFGQLGDGTMQNRATPVKVTGLAGPVTAISAGGDHTCALLDGGAMQCWGSNIHGQLGNGTFTSSPSPVDVIGLESSVIFLTSGGMHNCALTSAKVVQCWGINSYGQLGDGTYLSRPLPTNVAGLTNEATMLAAGNIHSCALLINGGMQCWGENQYGQLGDGTKTTRTNPRTVIRLAGAVTSISASGSHTCALLTSKAVQCWGLNLSGQVGNGSTVNQFSPTLVTGLAGDVSFLSGGDYHTCALLTNGEVQCWGDNYYDQLANGHQKIYSTATGLDINTAGQVMAGGFISCAVLTGGGVQCWGENSNGQLGDGTTTLRVRPVEVVGLTGEITNLTAGEGHTCGLLNNNEVTCWGANTYGQLGDGSTTSRATPLGIAGITEEVKAVTTGDHHTCALLINGTVQCWGANAYGQLGDGTNIGQPEPAQVVGLTGPVKAIAAGGKHTCALLNTGEVQCWGANGYGQLGNETTTSQSTATAVVGMGGEALDLAAGAFHTCARINTGGIQCWGQNVSGQLGDRSFISRKRPVNVSGLAGTVTAVAAGGYHNCALLADRTVQCWGYNAEGQLGDGTIQTHIAPVTVTGLSGGVMDISTGSHHSCALLDHGEVQCWGDNTKAQIGQGTAGMSSLPVFVTAPEQIAPPALTAIQPVFGRNDTPVRITVQGSGFLSGLIAQLEPGAIELENITLLDDGTFLATVPGGLEPGSYTLSVRNINSTPVTLSKIYSVFEASPQKNRIFLPFLSKD